MERRASIVRGVFHLDGSPSFLVSGDYPYYRDNPSAWGPKLDAIKSTGITTISCYVPWRHHAIQQPDGTIIHDFDGSTRPSRNVEGFLDLVKEKGMHVIAKPGPFIHAETVYGGLPDFTCPKNNQAIVPSKNAWGYDNKWFFMFGKPLPSPLEEPYVSMVKEYMARVGEVLQPRIYPDGPVIAIQILNEGIYSQGNISLDNFEYSPAGQALFRDHLARKHGNINTYNAVHGTQHASFDDVQAPRPTGTKHVRKPKDLINIIEWGEFATRYYNAVMDTYLGALHSTAPAASSVPVVINTNPPCNVKQGADTFLVRMVPESMHAHYGYTNWIGVVSLRDDSFYRYMLLVKRCKGMNLEENWGFSKYYDPLYAFGHVSHYQTLLAMAFGTTGFNVYTVVNTSSWYPELDGADPPYPRSAPITENVEKRDKCALVEFMTRLLGHENLGAKLAMATSKSNVHLGLYTPYATLHSWTGNDATRWKKVGLSVQPSVAEHAWTGFHLAAEHLGLDYTPVNIEDDEAMRAIGKPGETLVLVASDFLGQAVQERLVSLIQAGGKLVIAGTLPAMDDFFEPCTVLKNFLESGQHGVEKIVQDPFGRKFTMTAIEHGGKASTWLIKGNPFQRLLDKNEKKFLAILHFLKRLLPFGRQIPDAHAEGELAAKWTWMNKGYTKNTLAFACEITREIADATGWHESITYHDDHLAAEPVDVKGHRGVMLEKRLVKVFTRRFVDASKGETTDFVFVFSRSDEIINASFTINDHPAPGKQVDISMHVPPRSAHVIVLRAGKVQGFILNGVVPYINARAAVRLDVDGNIYETDIPCDVLAMIDGEDVRAYTAYVNGNAAYLHFNEETRATHVVSYEPDT